MGLIVLCGVGDDIILRNESGIGSPFRIELDHGIASACPFGGDEHYSVGSACSVDCARCSILEHGHGLHVVRIDFRDRSVIRHSVHNIEWSVAGTHRAYASDAYGSGTVCGVTGRGNYLDSRCSTCQRAGDIGDGPCLDGFGIDHGSRSCEGTPGGSTVGDNDCLVDEFSVRMELDIDDSA